MADRVRIIVVDDEPEIGEMIGEYLGKKGYEVRLAENADELRTQLAEQPAQIILLDINLPGEDGLSIARWLHERHDLGIIMVTAAGEVVDRVVGLEVGADDYITKPFDLRELHSRIRAVLRRTAVAPTAEAPSQPAQPEPERNDRKVDFGACTLDLDSHRLLLADGGELPLTTMEFDLLETFARHPNQVLTRDQLLEMAHNRSWEPFDRSIDIRIARIRRKIEDDPKKPRVIKTVRGAGYMFVPGGG